MLKIAASEEIHFSDDHAGSLGLSLERFVSRKYVSLMIMEAGVALALAAGTYAGEGADHWPDERLSFL